MNNDAPPSTLKAKNKAQEFAATGSAGVPPASSRAQQPRNTNNGPRGWHSRGYIPHFDGGEIAQFITFRTAGSVPAELVDKWKNALKSQPKTVAELEYLSRIEEYLDREPGSALLRNTAAAGAVENALLYFESERYRLFSWVVMPNHVHALLMPLAGHTVPGILHSIKSFTAKEANRILGKSGVFWQEDYFDRFIRNTRHFDKTVDYIEMNPVKAGLCGKSEDWLFCSARRRGGSA